MSNKRKSEDGWDEKQCTDCGEWWPDDKEFFFSSGPGILMTQCKACYLARRRAAGTKPPVRGPAKLQTV